MKLSQEVIELAELQAKTFKLAVSKDGTATAEGHDKLFETFLEANGKLDAAKEVQSLASTFYTATAKTVGEAALAAMKKHPSLQTVEVVVPLIGKDTFTVNMERSKTFPKPRTTTGETVTHYGFLNTKLDTTASRANAGMMKKIREDLEEAGAAALST